MIRSAPAIAAVNALRFTMLELTLALAAIATAQCDRRNSESRKRDDSRDAGGRCGLFGARKAAADAIGKLPRARDLSPETASRSAASTHAKVVSEQVDETSSATPWTVPLT